MALQEPTFLILTSLAQGRRHGYALLKDAETLSGGRVSLKVGTLYAALDRLTNEGLVEPAGEEVVDGRLRRFYVLTEEGAATLAADVERMRSLASQAATRLSQRPGLAFS
jgi:PadR family transcriptional regulator, regulatory protein PadR